MFFSQKKNNLLFFTLQFSNSNSDKGHVPTPEAILRDGDKGRVLTPEAILRDGDEAHVLTPEAILRDGGKGPSPPPCYSLPRCSSRR